MKKTRKIMLAAMLVAMLASGGIAEDLKIDGVWYRDAKWGTPTPLEVPLFHKEGVTRFPLASLSPELQQKFGYDPAKAAAHLEEQEKKWKEERTKKEQAEQNRAAPGQEETVPLSVIDGNLFYLKRSVVKTLYGPYECVIGTIIAVDKNIYEIKRVTNLLFSVQSAATKNILGPFWLKDEADVVLDGVSFKLMKPSSVVREREKLREERALITETQSSQSATQQVLETDFGLQNTRGAGKGQGLGTGVGTNETLKRRSGM